MHSLYLPNFRTKIDAIPGMTTRALVPGDEPGRFEIGCAQHCGVSHYKMRGLLIVARRRTTSRDWLARAETDSRLRYDPAAPTRDRRLGLGDGQVTDDGSTRRRPSDADDDELPPDADRLSAPLRLLDRPQGDRPAVPVARASPSWPSAGSWRC